MNNFKNQTVAEWAQEDLKYSVDADHKSQIPLYGVCLLMLFLPVFFIYAGISEYLNKGDKAQIMLALGFGLLLLFGAVVGYLVFYYRRILLRTLDKEGAEIRSGRKFLWNDLKYVNKLLSRNQTGIILRGYELIFGGGKAFIPANLKNIEKIEVLLALIPTEKRVNGKVSKA